MRIDFDNNPIEVMKLQGFLANFEGHTTLSLTGVFDQGTLTAVNAFQTKYAEDILEPWGHTAPTGYVYILTLKKINEIYCQRIFPLSEAQEQEIIAYRALLEGLGVPPPDTTVGSVPGSSLLLGIGGGSDPSIPPLEESPESGDPNASVVEVVELPVVGTADAEVIEENKEETSTSTLATRAQNASNLASVVFAQPGSWLEGARCAYQFVIILILLYILGNIIRSLFYKNIGPNQRKRFLIKWIVINVGLVASVPLAYVYEYWCLVLPFLVALLISLVWSILYPEHNSIRASVKSWYLVGAARIRSKNKNPKVKKASNGSSESDTIDSFFSRVSSDQASFSPPPEYEEPIVPGSEEKSDDKKELKKETKEAVKKEDQSVINLPPTNTPPQKPNEPKK